MALNDFHPTHCDCPRCNPACLANQSKSALVPPVERVGTGSNAGALLVAAHQDELNPKDRIGITKPQLHLVPPSSLIYQALALEDGASKYGAYNWREKKVKVSVYLSALQRHYSRYLDGEDIDPDSGKPHLGHILACVGIVVDAKETGNLVDDRPAPGASSKLIKQWTKTP